MKFGSGVGGSCYPHKTQIASMIKGENCLSLDVLLKALLTCVFKVKDVENFFLITLTLW